MRKAAYGMFERYLKTSDGTIAGIAEGVEAYVQTVGGEIST